MVHNLQAAMVDQSTVEQCDFSAAGHQPQASGAEQLAGIMQRLEELLSQFSSAAPALTLASGEGRDGNDDAGLIRQTRTPLPDPRLVRGIIRRRQLRGQFFKDELFADPAWDMLLDLTAARAEHRRVSVTSLCIASGVPTTTALRWIKVLEQSGLVERKEDDTDRRRAFIALSDEGAETMARYFDESYKSVGKAA